MHEGRRGGGPVRQRPGGGIVQSFLEPGHDAGELPPSPVGRFGPAGNQDLELVVANRENSEVDGDHGAIPNFVIQTVSRHC